MKSYITKKNGETTQLKFPLKGPNNEYFIDVFVPVHIFEEENEVRLVFLKNSDE